MKKVVRYAVLTIAFPFMLIGAVGKFAIDALGAGADIADALLDEMVDWIER